MSFPFPSSRIPCSEAGSPEWAVPQPVGPEATLLAFPLLCAVQGASVDLVRDTGRVAAKAAPRAPVPWHVAQAVSPLSRATCHRQQAGMHRSTRCCGRARAWGHPPAHSLCLETPARASSL